MHGIDARFVRSEYKAHSTAPLHPRTLVRYTRCITTTTTKI